ncbi:MAG TPA: LytTR family DNA-binding domain-containing protein [Flavobacteriales bacterium]|nr:response regulator transcription factor [Flavobacteriales bacterium]HPF68024.1 LytTR family DNA-binding domain-containing protein [Flavobacteriales bacterium]HPQ58082.1 LytTR family DNA-binding domain-containing protein [Flavobacteriales bacterium]HRW89906.1 LytTR family DNA-binding domain-containing protein [Flavobacteriales bacterium]
MRHIRTIIVDDEPAARDRVARLLQRDDEIELVAQCRNGQEAVEAVKKHRPDLLFLDVQMPGKNGFEVVADLDPNRLPFIVFVTAHDQYALQAFDVNAVDYLLKPYDDERFHNSLDKAKRFMDLRMSSKLTGRLMDLVREHMQANSEFTEVFQIRERGREHKVAVDDILYLRAEGNYLCLKMKDRQFLYRMTMNAVESELDPERFLRIHRSYIVNLAHVRGTRYSGNNEFIFTMDNGERIVSGRSYKEPIAKVLAEQEV